MMLSGGERILLMEVSAAAMGLHKTQLRTCWPATPRPLLRAPRRLARPRSCQSRRSGLRCEAGKHLHLMPFHERCSIAFQSYSAAVHILAQLCGCIFTRSSWAGTGFHKFPFNEGEYHRSARMVSSQLLCAFALVPRLVPPLLDNV